MFWNWSFLVGIIILLTDEFGLRVITVFVVLLLRVPSFKLAILLHGPSCLVQSRMVILLLEELLKELQVIEVVVNY